MQVYVSCEKRNGALVDVEEDDTVESLSQRAASELEYPQGLLYSLRMDNGELLGESDEWLANTPVEDGMSLALSLLRVWVMDAGSC